MQVHGTIATAQVPIEAPVPEARWLHLETPVLKEYGKDHANYKSGSRRKIAEKLYIRGVTYGTLSHVHLKVICQKAKVEDDGSKEVLAKRLFENPYPTAAESDAAAEAARAAAAAAAAAAANAAPAQNWSQAKKKLISRARDREMSKEACAAVLQDWGLLPADRMVFHIISPGVEDLHRPHHPHNYCVLPSYISSDYHQGAIQARLHHIAVLRMLGAGAVLAALEHCMGREQAAIKLAEIKADANAKGHSFASRKRQRPQAANGAAAAAAAAAGQGASDGESSDSDSSDSDTEGPGPSQRARAEGDAPAGGAQAQQEGVVELEVSMVA